MSLPIITQTFQGFRGDHEDLSIALIPDIFSPSESQNVEIDKLGEIVKILGYAKKNSAAITTDTGGSAVTIAGLYFYRSISSGTIARRLVAILDDGSNEYEIWHSTDAGVNWSFLKDLGSGPVGNVPRFAQWGNTLYITVGSGAPQSYDGSSVADTGGTQSPTPTLTESASVGPSSGNYECIILSMVGKTRQVASVVSSQVQLAKKKGTVSWTADGNGSVTGYEIYFTSGSGLRFYLAGYVDGRTTVAFTHDLSDSNLIQFRVLDEYGNAPASGSRMVGIHKQRTYWDRGSAAPDEWEYSTPSDPDGIGANNTLVLRDPNGPRDQNTGISGNYKGMAIFWQEFTVWRLSGTGVVINNVPDLRLEKTNATVGAVSDKSVVELPKGARYVDEEGNLITLSEPTLAYFSTFMDVRVFDGDGDTLVSNPKADWLADVQYQYRHLIWAEHDKRQGKIRFHAPHGSGQAVVNKAIEWDYFKGAWTEVSQTPFASGCESETSTSPQVLMTGESRVATGGFVYTNKSGNSYDGTGNDITAKFWTVPLGGIDKDGAPAADRTKRLRRIQVVMKAQASSLNLTIKTYGDFADSGATPHGTYTLDMAASNATHLVGRVVLREPAKDEFLEAKAPRLELTDTSDDPAWGIEKIILEYQVLPGRRRS